MYKILSIRNRGEERNNNAYRSRSRWIRELEWDEKFVERVPGEPCTTVGYPCNPWASTPLSLVNSPRCVRTHAHTHVHVRARGCDVASSPTAAILWRLERPSSFWHDRSSHRHSTCIVYSCLFNLYTLRALDFRFTSFYIPIHVEIFDQIRLIVNFNVSTLKFFSICAIDWRFWWFLRDMKRYTQRVCVSLFIIFKYIYIYTRVWNLRYCKNPLIDSWLNSMIND